MARVAKWWGIDLVAGLDRLAVREWRWLQEEGERLVKLEQDRIAKAAAQAKARRR